MKDKTKELISKVFSWLFAALSLMLVAWHIINLLELTKAAAQHCNCTWIG